MASKARSACATIIQRWPVDPLRPNLPFQRTLAIRVDREFPELSKDGTPISSQPTAAEEEEGQSSWFRSSSKKAKAEAAAAPQVKKSTTPPEIQWASLKPLLDNSFMKAYPVTERITRPQSNPDYYTNLLEELDEAPKRTFLSSYLNSWKGFIRWQ